MWQPRTSTVRCPAMSLDKDARVREGDEDEFESQALKKAAASLDDEEKDIKRVVKALDQNESQS